MATTYHYRLLDTEFGPVGFRNLVRMVRDGTITADDLVKADWEKEWHPAAEVVGLFHMAGRADVLEKWEEERRLQQQESAGEADLDEILNQAEAVGDEENEPSWKRRWREVQEQQQAHEAEKERERREEFAQARAQRRIQETISVAEAEFDQRDATRRPGRIQQWKDAVFSSSSLHGLFRGGNGVRRRQSRRRGHPFLVRNGGTALSRTAKRFRTATGLSVLGKMFL